MYDIRDVLRKAIAVSSKRKEVYLSVLEKNEDIKVQTLVRVLIQQIDRDIRGYEKMIEGLTDQQVEVIPFDVYDTISSLINQFMRKLVTQEFDGLKDFLKYAIDHEKAILALLLDIQGRLAQNTPITTSVAYHVLSEMILVKKRTIKNIEHFGG